MTIKFPFQRLALAISSCAFALQATAQSDTHSDSSTKYVPEEIIVTARKREESILKAPVVVQAITQREIEDLKITDTYQLSSVTPNLKITIGVGSVGATTNMRGLGNGMAANFIDQSVLLNVDGAALSHGAFYRGALFDLAQVEVLKGPQALFFGKSTSAGIVAVTSADPTSTWQSKISTGYEFNADEYLLDGYLSGPLSETVGVRIAGYYSEQEGWMRNRNPDNPNRRMPDDENYGGRLTLKYEGERLVARMKLTKTHNSNNAFNGDINQRNCTGDTAQVAGYAPYDDCKVNFHVSGNRGPLPYRPDLDYSLGSPAFEEGVPSSLFREDGRGYQWTKTSSALGTLDFELTEGLSLASLSSYSEVKVADAGRTFVAAPVTVIDLGVGYKQRSWSQELRLTSDFGGWFDFMAGGLYSVDKSKTALYLGVPPFTFYTDNDIHLKTETSSAFAQVLLRPTEQVELSVGARYTKVDKRLTSLFNRDNLPDLADFGDGAGDGQQLQDVPRQNRAYDEDNVSPEVTVTWRPTDDVTTFLSYKQGYKGPGYNVNTTATSYDANQAAPFGGEDVEGFEGGIKASLLQGRLALTGAVYRYDYEGIQVAFPNLVTNTVDVRNGADARIQGVELGAIWRPVSSLAVNAFVNYNDAEYKSFPAAPCFGGQTEAQGCVAPPGGAPVQDLGGTRLPGAPKWTAQLGLLYDRPLSDKLDLGLSFNSNYASKYHYTGERNPNGIQKGYVTLDSAIRLTTSDGLWEVALIGRNLTNEAVATDGQDAGTVIPGTPSDAVTFVQRSRQVVLQFTVRPHR